MVSRRMRTTRAFLALVAAAIGCRLGTGLTDQCTETPNVSRDVRGHMLVGKQHKQLFAYPTTTDGSSERTFRARTFEKLIFFLMDPSSVPRRGLHLTAENRGTGARESFEISLQDSEYGIAWGANLMFPEAGCWALSIDEAPEQGRIVIKVRA